MKAFNSTIVEKPKVISDISTEIYRTPIIEKLKTYGFDKVEKIMSDELSKLKQGKVKESLDELRSALEIFTHKITERVSEKVHPQDKLENNLDILKQKGLISDKMAGVLISIYSNKLYEVMSNITHKREDMNIRDGEFIYNIVEDYFNYLINKIIL